MVRPHGAMLFCLLCLLWNAPVWAQTGPAEHPLTSPTAVDAASNPSARDPQPPAPEEHTQPIPDIDPFKPPVKDDGKPVLTLTQALAVANAHNTDIEVAERQQKEAFWAFRSAAALPSAQIGLNYLNGSNIAASSSGLLPDTYLSASETFGPLGSRERATKAAYQGYEKAKANVAQVRLTVEQNVRDAYYGLRAAQESLILAQDTLEMANRILSIAKQRFEAGKSPRMDFLNAGIQQAASEQALITAQASLKQAQDTLNPLLGRAAHSPVEATGTLDLPAVKLIYSTLMEQAASNPKILAAIKDLQQNQTQVEVQRVQNNPNPGILFTYDLNIHQTTLGGILSIPIDFGANRNLVRQQLETVHEKESTLNGVRLTVSSSLKTAYDMYLGASQNADTFKSKVLDPSEEMVKITELGFSNGALPFLNLVTAEQAVKSARTQYVGLLLSGHQALDALEAATGTVLDGDNR